MNTTITSPLRLIPNKNSIAENSILTQTSTEEDIYVIVLHAYENRLISRRLKPKSVKYVMNTISDLVLFSNQYPWEWTSEMFEEWCAYLYKERNNCESTQRHKQNSISRFQSFLVESPKLSDLCKANFGKKPVLICSPENLIPHKVVDENKEKRLAFTKEHLKCLWSYFDNQIALAYKNKSKSLRVLQRDKVLYLIIYYYGLRANEVSMLDTTDFIHNPKRPEWDGFGGIIVRYGKASGGSPPKRRTVWTISNTPVQHLIWYLKSVRPLFGFDESNSIFLTERGQRMNPKSITQNFKEHLKCAGLPYENYSTHCLRHSYISHLSENLDLSPRFIQEQVGHTYLATTQIYTHLSDVFVSKQLTNVIDRQVDKYLKKG